MSRQEPNRAVVVEHDDEAVGLLVVERGGVVFHASSRDAWFLNQRWFRSQTKAIREIKRLLTDS